jgi:hypothetical protein
LLRACLPTHELIAVSTRRPFVLSSGSSSELLLRETGISFEKSSLPMRVSRMSRGMQLMTIVVAEVRCSSGNKRAAFSPSIT